ncbi:hypothetical protein D3C86_1777620 [compost metagenome]
MNRLDRRTFSRIAHLVEEGLYFPYPGACSLRLGSACIRIRLIRIDFAKIDEITVGRNEHLRIDTQIESGVPEAVLKVWRIVHRTRIAVDQRRPIKGVEHDTIMEQQVRSSVSTI